tara:strand:+ start:368 stop:1021 length:654 start_codon:yes stop_codon:yes gene_type:complete
MARPRFTGQGFTNPIDSLGFNAESRHRAMPPISRAFMSNETHLAENARGNQEFHIPGLGKLVGKGVTKQLGKGGAKKAGGRSLFSRLTGRGAKKKVIGEGGEEGVESAVKTQTQALSKPTNSATKNTLIKYGSFTVIGLAGVMGTLGIGEDFVNDLIGANCPDDAKAQGYAEGTPEYQKAVEECQDKAGNTVALIGMAGVAVLGLVLLVILRPKKSE